MHTLLANLRKPRKLFVSLLGIVLAAVWLGNVIASVLYRERYDPEALHHWATLSLMVYGGWHLLRVSWERPETSMEWTFAEQNNLLVSPFTREQLVIYRLTSVLGVTTFKSAIGVFLLLPDLPIPWLGFLSLWLALAFIELLRLLADTLTAGLSRRSYFWFRILVVAAVSGVAGWIILATVSRSQLAADSKLPIIIEFIRSLLSVIRGSVDTPVGIYITAPFALFVDTMLAERLTADLWLMAAAACSLLTVTTWGLIRLDRWCATSQHRQQKNWVALEQSLQSTPNETDLSNWRLPRWQLFGLRDAVVWRQLVGMSRHRMGVVLALIPPAVLAALPLFMARLSDEVALLNFLGGLVFYSFLLLPAAMKFDFRRDFSYLLLLKMLPLPAWRIVLGQMLTPILITTGFQYAMLGLACLLRDVPSATLAVAIVSFPAMNLAVYGWENLMFLIFPQRLKQEGLEVFLRTTIVFTAKAIACVAIFSLMVVWAAAASSVAAQLRFWHPWFGDHRLIFGIGVWCAVMLTGTALTVLAARQFQHLEALPDTQTA